jgi:hypothetical protein
MSSLFSHPVYRGSRVFPSYRLSLFVKGDFLLWDPARFLNPFHQTCCIRITEETVQGKEHKTTDRTTFSAFINEEHAQRRKAITVSQANELTAIDQRIINSIPGT